MLYRDGMNALVRLLVAVCGMLFLVVSPAAAADNVAFVLDASGSMWGQIDGKAKITIAKEVLNGLVEGLPPDMQVGLFAYGHRSKGDCQDIEMLIPVGLLDSKLMRSKIDGLNAKGKTPLSAAVQQAAKELHSTEEKATVILVSDGLETCHADPCAVATELAMSGVDFTVHVVGFDVTREEQTQLRCLADRTGGQFLTAANAESLRDALNKTVAKTKEPPKSVVEDPEPATLKAPASVAAGADFTIQWQGPDSRDDHIAMAVKKHQDQHYNHFVYTEMGNPARMTAPGDTGEYELRYVHAQSGKVIGKADITVTAVQASLQAPASAQVAAEFEVVWEGPDYAGDYIALYLAEDTENIYQHYGYTQDGNPVKLRAPSDPGRYELRYIIASDTTVLAKLPITIEGVGAKVDVPEFVDVAAEFEVGWQGPNSPGDYISIATPETDGGNYTAYTYTEEGTPLRLRAPSDPGQYEVRYILGQDNKILAKASVTILGVVAQVEAPETAHVAAQFKVSWQGPNNSGDYISITLPDGEGSAYTAYTYTEEGSPLELLAPSDPGQYEVRYILGQDNKILARTPITIASVNASVQPPVSVPAGASFQVDWLGPSAEGDYITVASSQSEADQYDNYAYTQDGNPAKLRAPAEPGRYEIRYILGHGGKLLAAVAIEVTAISASVSAPVEVAAQALFTVEWQGPGYPGDHVTIAEPEAAGDEYASYIYTEGGTSGELTAPGHAGLYEVRYIMDSGKKILGKTTITVK